MIQGYCEHCDKTVRLIVIKTVPEEREKKVEKKFFPTEFAFCSECNAWNCWL